MLVTSFNGTAALLAEAMGKMGCCCRKAPTVVILFLAQLLQLIIAKRGSDFVFCVFFKLNDIVNGNEFMFAFVTARHRLGVH